MAYTILSESYGRRLPKITAEADSTDDLTSLGVNYAEGSTCDVGGVEYALDKVQGWVIGGGSETVPKIPAVSFGESTVIVDTTTVSFVKDGGNAWYKSAEISGMTFDYSTIYTVTWDGITYECFCFLDARDKDDLTSWHTFPSVGNAGIIGHSAVIGNESAPFLIVTRFAGENDTNVYALTLDGSASHTISVSAKEFTKEAVPSVYYANTLNGRDTAVFDNTNDEGAILLPFGAVATGTGAIAFGAESKATGDVSIAGGSSTAATNSGSVSLGFLTTSSGMYSVALGNRTVASGNNSFAIGSKSSTGDPTTASGQSSAAFGVSVTASGGASLAVGQKTVANASMSCAIGNDTKATGRAAMAIGQFNIADDNPVDTSHGTGARKYLFTIGNGTADNARSNAVTVDWSGNEELAGSITLGKGTADEVTLTAAQLKALLALLN